MPKKIEPEEDEWFGVQDPKKRKQIQDRLAQRARRIRLAKSTRKHSRPSSSPVQTPSSESSQALVSPKSNSSPLIKESPYLIYSLPRLSAELSQPIMTINSALYHHGIILGISCVTGGVHRSQAAGPHVPAPLRPTQLQLDEAHYSFIDRVPHKDLRHNMIKFSEEFSAEEYLADLLTMPSYFIEPGYQSWDPEGWSVAAAFRMKWIVLFGDVDFRIV